MATVVPASSSSPSLPTDTQTAAATAPPALVPQGKAIADGHVVSSFRGGLIAVRVDDDIADVLAVAAPEIVDPGQVLPRGISSKSSLGKLNSIKWGFFLLPSTKSKRVHVLTRWRPDW